MEDYRKKQIKTMRFLTMFCLLFLVSIKEADASSIAERTKDWAWPSDGIISDLYNTRNGHHKGIDIAGSINESVYVVDSGMVMKSYYSNSYGNVVFIKHASGLETVYAHLNKRMVKQNDRVKKGQVIGKMGSTGNSSGVHLHFEIHNKEWTITKKNAVDPMVALGKVEVGQAVHASVQKEKLTASKENKKRKSVEVVKSMPLAEENKAALHKDKAKKSARKVIVYTIKANDTLWSIAKRDNVSVAELKRWNNKQSDVIIEGEKLLIK
ncbi:peptidoglycan DD-metalloendopeptidase family protein [Niallia sp. NCCP-28]|uniref:peptidoglycan DD-metalloendopeptidase family protein n=1 Tax=Niallia sp. NCCP-28 TaxID=2934712 RepID=UPI002088168F|nr:peptidoglycan DD-metalloendopeptidase family protein [Niallia sp. NCCP-28]GKU81047.1 peptidase M23 [Niallia sp. NCCP-28]